MKNRLLDQTRKLAEDFLDSLPTRAVHATADVQQLRASIHRPLSDQGVEADSVLRDLAGDADPGLIASAGPRYFGYVIGGSLPVALAADWLVSTWDQNAGIYSTSPALSVIEEAALSFVLDLLGLPQSASAGFVTGCQAANTTCLAAARHAVLRRVGWNVEEQGLSSAPPVNLVLSAEAHITIHSALRLLGFGLAGIRKVPTDKQGRMVASELQRVLAECSGPTIVCAQAGNVNTGAFDPLSEVIDLAHERGAWVHIDGAFGLWAAASKKYKTLLSRYAEADSWATDAHKWLNVPYDSGIAIVADSAAHRASMTVSAAYLEQTSGEVRDSVDWNPEFSRRGRAVPIYAAVRFLGRDGVRELVEQGCAQAAKFAEILAAEDGVRILNEVVLNQVLVRFERGDGDGDELTRRVIKRVQDDGICWLSGTTWQGVAAMRISVSNWSTTMSDVEQSAAAILSAFRACSVED